MKKRIIKAGVCLSIVVLATIGVKMANSEQISSIGLVFSNMEALASDSEGNIKVTTCIGKKTECILSDGTRGWGKPVQISVEY